MKFIKEILFIQFVIWLACATAYVPAQIVAPEESGAFLLTCLFVSILGLVVTILTNILIVPLLNYLTR